MFVVCSHNNQNKKKFTVINSLTKIPRTWHLFFMIVGRSKTNL